MTKSAIVFVVSLLGASIGCSSSDLGDDSNRSDLGGDPDQGGKEPGGPVVGEEGPIGPVTPAEVTAPLYPAGPYGRGVGGVMADMSFLGWRDPVAAAYDTSALELISLSDFYNPDGAESDVKLLLINASAVWCTVCRGEYQHFENDQVYATYRAKGVEILGVIFEDNDYRPAKPSDLELWGGPRSFSVPFPLVLDPGLKTGIYFTSDATPLNLLVDARTMRIIDVAMGYNVAAPDEYWARIDTWLAEH